MYNVLVIKKFKFFKKGAWGHGKIDFSLLSEGAEYTYFKNSHRNLYELGARILCQKKFVFSNHDLKGGGAGGICHWLLRSIFIVSLNLKS